MCCCLKVSAKLFPLQRHSEDTQLCVCILAGNVEISKGAWRTMVSQPFGLEWKPSVKPQHSGELGQPKPPCSYMRCVLTCTKLVSCEKRAPPELGAGQPASCTFPGKRQVLVLLGCSHSHVSGRTMFLCIGLQFTLYNCPALQKAALPNVRHMFCMCLEKGEGWLLPMPCFEVAYLYWYMHYNSESAGLRGCLTLGMEDDSGRTGGISGCLGLAVWGRPGRARERGLGIHTVPTGRQSGGEL